MNESRRRWVLLAMCSVVGVVLFDESGVAIALTEIRSDLGMSRSGVNWVLTIYLVSLSATVAAFGRLADVAGLKAVLIGGSLTFGVTSIAAGLATDPAWLLLARAVQGLGAAAAFPASAGIVRAITPPEKLGRALGIFGTSSAVGLTAGPLLGGWLVETVSWRTIFFLSAPVVLFVVGVTWRALEPPERDASARSGIGRGFDWGGLLLLAAALGALIGGLMQGPVWGWSSTACLAAFVASAVCFTLLVLVERGRAQPVIEVALFRDPTFLSANAVTLFAQFGKTAVIVFGPYYLIQVLGMSAFDAGNALLPGIFVAMFAAPWVGGRVDRIGSARGPVLLALVALCASLVYLSFAVSRHGYAVLVPGLVVWGYGASAMFAGSRRAVQAAVPATKAGQASGVNSTAQWLGAALSVPTLGAFVHAAPDFARLYLVAAGVIAFATLLAFWLFQRRPVQSPPREAPGPA